MWEYQGLLNADLVILLTIVVGAIAILARVFKRSDTAAFSTFLFCFTLPASVIEGLGCVD